MPPASHSAEREEERRLKTRTLTIASIASASAAAVTSQLWIAGTWIAAALTPVLVTLISEAMHRPTERIARAWTADRETRDSGAVSPTRTEPTAVTGAPGPVRVYRQTARGEAVPERRTAITTRRIPVRAVAVTAAIAFMIGIAILTTVDLVSGGSVGKGSGRTTAFGGGGGGGSKDAQKQEEQNAKPQQQEQQPQTESPDRQQDQPSEPPATEEPAPQTPPSETAPRTAPTETAPTESVPETTP
jgi:hypothetical protein